MTFVTPTFLKVAFSRNPQEVFVLLILVFFSKLAHGQFDSNVNTLRYDGEVNIGKNLLRNIM